MAEIIEIPMTDKLCAHVVMRMFQSVGFEDVTVKQEFNPMTHETVGTVVLGNGNVQVVLCDMRDIESIRKFIDTIRNSDPDLKQAKKFKEVMQWACK